MILILISVTRVNSEGLLLKDLSATDSSADIMLIMGQSVCFNLGSFWLSYNCIVSVQHNYSPHWGCRIGPPAGVGPLSQLITGPVLVSCESQRCVLLLTGHMTCTRGGARTNTSCLSEFFQLWLAESNNVTHTVEPFFLPVLTWQDSSHCEWQGASGTASRLHIDWGGSK